MDTTPVLFQILEDQTILPFYVAASKIQGATLIPEDETGFTTQHKIDDWSTIELHTPYLYFPGATLLQAGTSEQQLHLEGRSNGKSWFAILGTSQFRSSHILTAVWQPNDPNARFNPLKGSGSNYQEGKQIHYHLPDGCRSSFGSMRLTIPWKTIRLTGGYMREFTRAKLLPY